MVSFISQGAKTRSCKKSAKGIFFFLNGPLCFTIPSKVSQVKFKPSKSRYFFSKNVINFLQNSCESGKFKSFNWNVIETSGHNIGMLVKSLNILKKKKNKPHLLIAHTIKGKSVKFMENKFESHYHVLNEKDYKISLKGLRV